MDTIEGGTEVIEQQPVETQEVETQETDVTEPQVEEQQELEVQEPKLAAKEIEDALKSLRESNPKIAKTLRAAVFSDQQFRQQFPNPAAAKAAKVVLDTVGGPEGIADLREQVQANEFVEQAAEAGDASLIEDWAADYPEGFKKVMPAAMRQFEKMDGQGFKTALQPYFYGFLEHAGLSNVLESLWKAVGDNKPEDAKSLIQQTYRWLEGQKAEAPKDSVDPDREKLTRERQEFDQERDKAFRGDIGRDTFKYQQDSVEKALTPYLKGRKLTDQGKQRLVRAINADINDTLKNDQAYQRQVRAFLTKRDAQGTARYIKGHLDTIISGIVDGTWKALYGAPVGRPVTPKSAEQTAKPQIGAPIKVQKKPSLSEVEKSNGYMEAYIAGKAIMATGPMKGKLVTWR